MLRKCIFHFNDLSKNSIDLVGGKGANLGELVKNDFPIPEGFCITVDVYKDMIDGLQGEIKKKIKTIDWDKPSDIDKKSLQIKELIIKQPVSAKLQEEIIAAYGKLSDSNQHNMVAVAVRSSATAEDLPEASFAGQHETYLNVTGNKELISRVKACWASLWNTRAMFYRHKQNYDHTLVYLSVVIQKMVESEVAGVAFSADPLNGHRDEIQITSSYGLGEVVVSGSVTPDSFILNKKSLSISSKKIGTKEKELLGTGGSTQMYDVSMERRNKYSLSDHQLIELGEMVRRVEEHYGCPQDIEWAFSKGRLYLLQARPITTLNGKNSFIDKWNDSLTGDYLWSNVNFGEAIHQVMTPLSWSVQKFIAGSWKILPGYQPFGIIAGRPYVNISIFASFLHALGKSRKAILEFLEGTLYTQIPKEMQIPIISLSLWTKTSLLFNLIKMQLKQKRVIEKLPRYLTTNPAWCSKMQEQIQAVNNEDELTLLWQSEISPHLAKGVWNVMGSVSNSTEHTIKLRRKLTEWVGLDDADRLISNLSSSSDLTSGSGLLASLGPLLGIAKVACGEMDRSEYLTQYGHRGSNEFELSALRPVEDPSWLDEKLEQFRKIPVDVEALLAKQRAEVDAAWNRFKATHPRKARKMRRYIDEVAPRARLREAVRSEYVRERWIARTFALRAGQLVGLGDDIFFLNIEEVLDVLSGYESAVKLIPARKETYRSYSALPAYPSIILGSFDPFKWAADPNQRNDIYCDYESTSSNYNLNEEQSNIIFGSPGSAGRIEGVVRRLNSLEEGEQLKKGEILVTSKTDINWTLLFPRTAAIVTDVGAPLSHAAIVARELGIPAVVGCGNATMRLNTGDRVVVDGGRGIVMIMDHT